MGFETSEGRLSLLKEHWQKFLAVAFWLVVLSVYGVYSYQHGLTPWQTLKRLGEFLTTSSWGPLVFIALYTVRPIFLFSAAVLTIGAGAFFGTVWGFVYCVIGSNASAAVAFAIGRFLGEGVLDESARSESGMGRGVQRMRDSSFETVFLMRLAFLPYDLVNYMAGFLKIRFTPFLLATALGSLPGTLSFVLFGASSGLSNGTPSFDWRVMAASVAIFVLSIAVSKAVKRRDP